MKFGLAMVAVALALAGCGTSPPVHFFTLAAVSPVGSRVSKISAPVRIDAVHIPAILDRQEMVRRTGAATVSITDRDRWAAPLGEMARDVLTRDLAERLGKQSVILPRAPLPASGKHLVVNIASFGETSDHRVRLQASWTLMQGEPPQPVLVRDVNLEVKAAGADAASQVAAMSELLGKLADRIAAALSTQGDKPKSSPVSWRTDTPRPSNRVVSF